MLSSVQVGPGFVQAISENGISAGWERPVGSNSSVGYFHGPRVIPVLVVGPHCTVSTHREDHRDGMLPTAAAPLPGRAEHAGARWVCNACVSSRRSAELNLKTSSAPCLGCCQRTPQVSKSELVNQLSFVFMIFLNEKFGESLFSFCLK